MLQGLPDSHDNMLGYTLILQSTPRALALAARTSSGCCWPRTQSGGVELLLLPNTIQCSVKTTCLADNKLNCRKMFWGDVACAAGLAIQVGRSKAIGLVTLTCSSAHSHLDLCLGGAHDTWRQGSALWRFTRTLHQMFFG